jgi:hypothetical protein
VGSGDVVEDVADVLRGLAPETFCGFDDVSTGYDVTDGADGYIWLTIEGPDGAVARVKLIVHASIEQG